MPRIPIPQVPGPARALGGVFGLVFGGAGVCMLFLIWGDDSDFVPVPARLFGSLICLAFIAMGGTMLFSAIAGGGMLGAKSIDLPDLENLNSTSDAPPPPVAAGKYVCPNCGAALGDKADVSPMGDVKCQFCGRWFNVHGRNA